MHRYSILAVLLLLGAIGGCQHPQSSTASSSHMVVIEVTFSPPDACAVALVGKTYLLPDDQAALLAALRNQASKLKRARVVGDYNTVPYKCFGGAVFLAQSAGFKSVGFISESPATSSNH